MGTRVNHRARDCGGTHRGGRLRERGRCPGCRREKVDNKRALIPLGSNSLRLQIEEMPISELKRPVRRPRIHPEKQIVMLSRNIDTFGFLVPCLIDLENRLLTGTARVLAAERLGMKVIP